MKPIQRITAHRLILAPVYRLAKREKRSIYLVGGILRDILLGRHKGQIDFDLCMPQGALAFGARLAKEIKAGYVVLDKEHAACRVVKKLKDAYCTFDITGFRGRDLNEDLRLRDFSINTLALDILEVFRKGEGANIGKALIDPFAGVWDLQAKIIRAVYEKAFEDDPLRILRAFSLQAILGFTIEPKTARLMRLSIAGLSAVSPERIRDELFKILNQDNSYAILVAMDKLKILSVILPELDVMRKVRQGPYHHLDVWNHSLECVRQLELFFKEQKRNSNIQNHLNEVISGERSRRSLLKFGTLLHDIGKPKALRREEGKTKFHGHELIGARISEDLCRRLKLSNDEIDSLKRMVFWHLRPGYLADNEPVTARAKFRYFRDTAQDALSVLMLSVADQRATRGPLTSLKSRRQHERIVLGLIKEYFRRSRQKKVPRLITGDDLMDELRLGPSKLIGKMLREVEELQAAGKVRTRLEALKAARRLIR